MARTGVFFRLEQWRSAEGQSWLEGEKRNPFKGGQNCNDRQAEMNKRREKYFTGFSVGGDADLFPVLTKVRENRWGAVFVL